MTTQGQGQARKPHLSALIGLALLQAACSAAGQGRVVPSPKGASPLGQGAPAAAGPLLPPPPGAPLVRLPGGEVRAFEGIVGGGSLAGTISLRLVTPTGLTQGAAPFRLMSEPSPVAYALVAAGRLDEALFTRNGEVVHTTTGPDGTFAFAGEVPATRTYVVTATLAGGHRLAALAFPGSAQLPIDEASTMVAEMARWQLRPEPTASAPGRPVLADLDATTALVLQSGALDLVSGADLEGIASGTGIPALRAGAGHLVRNAYVEGFGRRVTTAGLSSPPAANVASDAWASYLGYRPLALSLVAGTGERASGVTHEGKLAEEAPLFGPSDALQDTSGDLFIANQDGNQLVYVPSVDRPGPVFGFAGPFQAGRIHYLPGAVANTQELAAYNQALADATVSGVPPLVAQPFPLIKPGRLLLLPGDHLLVSSTFGYRLMLLPRTDTTAFGRAMQAGRLYTVAGTGEAYLPAGPSGNGGLGTSAALDAPTGVVKDPSGNLYFLEAGLSYGTTRLRMLRQSDGRISQLPITLDAAPYAIGQGSKGLAISPDGASLYLADAARHVVLRLPTPSPTAVGDVSATAPTMPAVAATRLLGKLDTAGFVNTDEGVPYPSLYELFVGVAPESGPTIQCLLNRPVGLALNAAGDLLVADAGNRRLRLLHGGALHTVGGGFDLSHVHGDARLCDFPALSQVQTTAEGDFLVVDGSANRVRRLWARRGFF